jgi:hypothetical protein
MASLYFLKRLTHGSVWFRPAKETPEIILSAVSKTYIEHKLLVLELSTYALMTMPLVDADVTSPLVVVPFMACIPLTVGYPMYRTYTSYKNKELQILNL